MVVRELIQGVQAAIIRKYISPLEREVPIADQESTEYLRGYLASDDARRSFVRDLYREWLRGKPVDVVVRRDVLERRLEQNPQ